MTVAVPTDLSARTTLAELRSRGYTLTLNTKVQVVEVKVGTLYLTVAGTLSVRGSEAPPDYLREAMHRYAPELKAAVAVSNPPVEWLRELVRRYRTGDAYTPVGDAPVTLDVLCANLASFLGLDPIEDASRLREIVDDELGGLR
jgi:hypothetical protein